MTMKIMKLRPAQKLYVDKIYEPLLLNFGKTLEPSHSELPCNFGKTELIVRYNTLRVIQETKKSIHICATVMASPYDTFVERLPSKEDDEFPYGKNTWFNRSDTDLDYFLNNLSLILSKYNHIIIFTTLNKLNTVTSKPLFDNLMNKGKKEGFMWYLDRDEGDYAGFDDSEQQAFESGASVEMGGSKYAQSLLKMFSDYKDNCGYLYAVSGTPLNAHSDKAELLNEVGNAVALTQSQSMKKDKQGIVTDDLQKYVSTKSFWKPLITEEMFYQMKNLNVEFNSWFSKPETYHRRDWKILMKDSIEWRNKKQIKINNLKSWLIDNVINFYPDVNKNNFINIFDKHQKISLYQNGKEGTYKSQVSFIKPSEFINELKKYDSTNNTYVHSNSNIEGTIPSIDKQEIKDKKIDTIGVTNLLSRGFDLPHIVSIAILATSPKLNKKSLSAPYTKRQIQTVGRAARHGNGLKDCGSLSEARDLLLKLGININQDNEFNHKFREFIIENLEAKVWLLYDDKVDTDEYVKRKIRKYYVTYEEMKNAVDLIFRDKVNDVCPTCGRPWHEGSANMVYDNFDGIDEALTKPSLWSKIKKFLF